MIEKYNLITELLLKSKDKDPIKIILDIMSKDFISMHGPEHHYLDGACFLTALYNNGITFDLEYALNKLQERAQSMPGAMCGYWGVCGSVTSIGAALSILHEVGPLSDNKYYKDDMEFTSSALSKISKIGGPRCCKRNAFISISTGVTFVNDKYGFNITCSKPMCQFSSFNKECIKEKCPFHIE